MFVCKVYILVSKCFCWFLLLQIFVAFVVIGHLRIFIKLHYCFYSIWITSSVYKIMHCVLLNHTHTYISDVKCQCSAEWWTESWPFCVLCLQNETPYYLLNLFNFSLISNWCLSHYICSLIFHELNWESAEYDITNDDHRGGHHCTCKKFDLSCDFSIGTTEKE